MDNLKQVLAEKFGKQRVSDFPLLNEHHVDLLQVDLELRSSVTLLMTNGLYKYNMPIPEKLKEFSNIELYFCLPSYWELDMENERFNWVYFQIQKLAQHLIDQQTWFGVGHTFSNGNPLAPFSSTMKQNHLLLTEPIMLEDHLADIVIDGKPITFLAIVPIFEDEFDYKMAKGYFKFIRKFRAKNNEELLDDFRQSVKTRRFGLF
jgi:hypothetical protein